MQLLAPKGWVFLRLLCVSALPLSSAKGPSDNAFPRELELELTIINLQVKLEALYDKLDMISRPNTTITTTTTTTIDPQIAHARLKIFVEDGVCYSMPMLPSEVFDCSVRLVQKNKRARKMEMEMGGVGLHTNRC
jgi:hypothetical protein